MWGHSQLLVYIPFTGSEHSDTVGIHEIKEKSGSFHKILLPCQHLSLRDGGMYQTAEINLSAQCCMPVGNHRSSSSLYWSAWYARQSNSSTEVQLLMCKPLQGSALTVLLGNSARRETMQCAMLCTGTQKWTQDSYHRRAQKAPSCTKVTERQDRGKASLLYLNTLSYMAIIIIL